MRKSFYLTGFVVFFFIFSFAITARAQGPSIVTQPHDTAICGAGGGHAIFTVAAVDTPGSLPMTYFWQGSDNFTDWYPLSDTAIYHGVTKDTLSISTAIHIGPFSYYRVHVANSTDSLYSDTVYLRIDGTPGPIIGITPICAGSTLALSDDLSGGVWSNVRHSVDTVDAGGNLYGIYYGFDTIKYTVTNKCGVNTVSSVIRVDTVTIPVAIMGPDVTCVGHMIHLTNPDTPGVWSATNALATIDASGTLTAVSQGLDTIHYAFTNTCNTADTFIVISIDTVLNPGTISGTSGICAGDWTTLTSSLSGGDWLSSNSAVAVVDMSGNVTGISQGTVTISYYFSNACGTSTATHAVTVSIPAGVITGLDSVGVGNTRTYTDATPGGVWSMTGGVATVGSAAGVVTGVSAGSATLLYTVNNACGTTDASMVLYVGPAPSAGVIHGKDTVCIGHTITLSDTASGGVWTNGNDSIATVSNTGVVTGLVRGTDHITYTVTNGFGSSTSVHSVFVNRKPIDSISVPSILAEGGYYIFNGYTKKDTTWAYTAGTWTSSNDSVGGFIGTPGYFVLCCYSGSTTITYSATNPCGTTDTSFTITVPHFSGVNELKNNNAVLNVYPNPSGGEFTINLKSAVSEEATVIITDIVGQKVKEFTMLTNQASELQLDQPDGIYFLTATSSTGKYSAKISITK